MRIRKWQGSFWWWRRWERRVRAQYGGRRFLSPDTTLSLSVSFFHMCCMQVVSHKRHVRIYSRVLRLRIGCNMIRLEPESATRRHLLFTNSPHEASISTLQLSFIFIIETINIIQPDKKLAFITLISMKIWSRLC